LLNSPCGREIPRSGKEGEEVNCYIVYLFQNDAPFLVVKEINGNTITGIQWNGDRFDKEKIISLFEINKYQIKITHYYGLYTTKYSSVWDFLAFGITKYEVIKCNFHKLFSRTSQFVFTKKKLATFDRIEILRSILDLYFSSTHNGFSSLDIMTKLYSLNWVIHPESEQQQYKIELFLKSFVESGELEIFNGYEYSVNGKAITTLSEYEEQERKHSEAQRMQKQMVWLTLAIVLVGIMQAIITYCKWGKVGDVHKIIRIAKTAFMGIIKTRKKPLLTPLVVHLWCSTT
jgi:hypothetical protein